MNSNICAVTVVIPTYNRPSDLLVALAKITACVPAPEEIIVHIDGDDNVTEAALDGSPFQQVKILHSQTQAGPGGGRNRAIAAAQHEIVASFDDDSYPIDPDYFARLLQLFADFPEAAVIGAGIYHQNEAIALDEPVIQWVADFVGCGCAYRRTAFLQTSGYVQLPVAYDMEEVDLSLRLYDLGWRILRSPWLRVFHDTSLEHHQQPSVTAASIANRALLTYLRYPPTLWWLGAAQCLNRIAWLLRNQRFAGIMTGLLSIPTLIQQNVHHRQLVSAQSLKSYFQLRRYGLHESFPLDLLSDWRS
jgi:GT2 family glycosyltransferase